MFATRLWEIKTADVRNHPWHFVPALVLCIDELDVPGLTGI